MRSFRLFLIVLLLTVIMHADAGYANEPRKYTAEISLSWSVIDRIGFYVNSDYSFPKEFRSPVAPGENASYSGSFVGGLMMGLGRGWAMGIFIGYMQSQTPGRWSRHGFSADGQNDYRRTTLSTEVRYTYYSQSSVRLYARLGLGFAEHSFKFIGPSGPGQGFGETRAVGYICPMGIAVGQRLRGFAELGYGYRGHISFGLALRFSGKRTAN